MAVSSGELFILALGLDKKAGVTEARVDYPLRALNELSGITAWFGSGTVKLPDNFREQSGIFILHRQIMGDEKLRAKIQEFIDHGWVIVSDIDDDPHHWRGFIESDFFAFRSVHAVTVSTEPLANMVRKWNPNVRVFANEIFQLPESKNYSCPKNQEFSIFFGALNRLNDWKSIEKEMVSLAQQYPNIHWRIVHDRNVFETLPSNCMKTFYPTLNHREYMEVLASCDVSLLPLNETQFNNHKSDLKLIESCACQTVPICSPVVYGKNPRHFEVARFPLNSSDWYDQLKFFIENPKSLIDPRNKGLEYVKNERMHSMHAPARATYYYELLSKREDLETQRQDRVRQMGISLN